MKFRNQNLIVWLQGRQKFRRRYEGLPLKLYQFFRALKEYATNPINVIRDMSAPILSSGVQYLISM